MMNMKIKVVYYKHENNKNHLYDREIESVYAYEQGRMQLLRNDLLHFMKKENIHADSIVYFEPQHKFKRDRDFSNAYFTGFIHALRICPYDLDKMIEQNNSGLVDF